MKRQVLNLALHIYNINVLSTKPYNNAYSSVIIGEHKVRFDPWQSYNFSMHHQPCVDIPNITIQRFSGFAT